MSQRLARVPVLTPVVAPVQPTAAAAASLLPPMARSGAMSQPESGEQAHQRRERFVQDQQAMGQGMPLEALLRLLHGSTRRWTNEVASRVAPVDLPEVPVADRSLHTRATAIAEETLHLAGIDARRGLTRKKGCRGRVKKVYILIE